MTDLDRLDAYLSSDDSPANCLLLSDLDGFSTGVLCSPYLIMPSEWLPIVWGGEGSVTSKNPDEQIWAMQEVLSRYNQIAYGLNNEPPVHEPIFWQAPEGHVIAMDWCEGFGLSFKLRPDQWNEFASTDLGKQWLYPIRAHLFDEEGRSLIGAAEEDLDSILAEAAEQIPHVVCKIFTYWKSKRVIRN